MASLINFKTDNIVKLKEDHRSYRGIELNNGLKLFLISDSTIDKAAACLCISIGNMHDPKTIPGLAHLLQRTLLKASKKYPNTTAYEKFLKIHDGTANAETGTDHTTYQFDIDPEYLEGALDFFANCFIHPLFSIDPLEPEIDEIEIEYQNNLQNDMYRFEQLHRSFSKSDHDYAKFGMGNRKTLIEDARSQNLDIHSELKSFFKTFYSPNLMTVCVIGPQSLDDLVNFVVPLFGELQNTNKTRSEWLEHPYGPQQLGHRLEVVPNDDLRMLHIFFAVPDLSKEYRSKPYQYLDFMMLREDEGSLSHELYQRGLITKMEAECSIGARGFAFYTLDYRLTEEGLDEVEAILEMTIVYIHLLITTGPHEWIHRECEKVLKSRNHASKNEESIKRAVLISQLMQQYPLEEVLIGPYVMPDYRPDLIKMVLNQLYPKNMGYGVISQKFKNTTDKKEIWFGTDYSIKSIDWDFMERLENCKNGIFSLPKNKEGE